MGSGQSAAVLLVTWRICDGNRSAYLRPILKVMKSIMIASQLRSRRLTAGQRTAELASSRLTSRHWSKSSSGRPPGEGKVNRLAPVPSAVVYDINV